MNRVLKAKLIAGPACLLVWLLGPASARADVASCSFNAGSHTATVTIVPGAQSATIASFRASDGALVITNYEAPSTGCGTATRFNTDQVIVNNASASQPLSSYFYLQIPEAGVTAPNGPGFTNEPGSSDEIEFTLNFGPGGKLAISPLVSTSDPGSPVDLALGGNQINLNAGESDGVDADVTLNGVSRVLIYGSDHSDLINGNGGSGTPATPFTIPMEVETDLTYDVDPDTDTIVTGSAGDTVRAGPRSDSITTGDGNDQVLAGAGDDLIRTGPGADSVQSGDGNDQVFTEAGKDSVLAGPGDDLVFGAGGKDLLRGEQGMDLLAGGHENDRLLGGLDPDRLNGGAGRKDRCSKSKQDHRKKCEILVGD